MGGMGEGSSRARKVIDRRTWGVLVYCLFLTVVYCLMSIAYFRCVLPIQ